MRWLSCFTLFVFMLTAWTENEVLQEYHREQTEATTVTIEELLRRKNLTGHFTAATAEERRNLHTVVSLNVKFPRTTFSHTTPSPPYGETQITEASAVIASPSRAHFVSSSRPDLLMLTEDNLSGMSPHNEQELPLIYDNEVIFSSTQAAFESMMKDTSEPEVHLSTDREKTSFWQGNTDSINFPSADRGLQVSVLSKSHLPISDNLAEPHNDNGVRFEGRDGKVFLEEERKEYLFGAAESSPQGDKAEGLVKRTNISSLCLNCADDGKAASIQKSTALPLLFVPGSLYTVTLDRPDLDINNRITTLPSIIKQSIREQEQIINREIPYSSKMSSLSLNEDLVRQNYNSTHILFSTNIKASQSQTILNDSLVDFFSQTKTLDLNTALPQVPFKMQTQTKKPYLSESFDSERPILKTIGLNHSSSLFHNVSNKLNAGENHIFPKPAIRDPQSTLIFGSKSKINNGQRLDLANFENEFLQDQILDLNSSKEDVIQEGTNHNDESHPTTDFHLRRSTTSAISNHVFHSLTGAKSLMSVFSGFGQLPASPSIQPTEPLLNLISEGAGSQLVSVTKITHMTERQQPQELSDAKKQTMSSIDLSLPVKSIVKKQHAPSSTATNADALKFDDTDVSVSVLTMASGRPFSKRVTMNRLLGTLKKSRSKITLEMNPGETTEDSLGPQHQTSAYCNGDVIRPSKIAHDLISRDSNEQDLTLGAKTEVIMRREGELEKLPKDQEEEERQTREENEFEGDIMRGEMLRHEETKVRGQKETAVEELSENTEREEDRMEEDKVKTKSEGEEHRVATEGEDIPATQARDESVYEVVTDKEGTTEEDKNRTNEEKSSDEENMKGKNSHIIKQKDILTNIVELSRRDETGPKEDMNASTEIEKNGINDVTTHARQDILLEPTVNSKEVNRGRAQTFTSTLPSHGLVKQSEATGREGIYMGENIEKYVEIKHISFSSGGTNTNRPLQALTNQSQELSRAVSLPKKQYAGVSPHLSIHKATFSNHAIKSLLKKQSNQHKDNVARFTMTAIPKIISKVYQSSYRISTPFQDNSKTKSHKHSTATINSTTYASENASNLYTLSAPQSAITAGVLTAQTHFTVNTLTHNLSIIYDMLDQRHQFGHLVSEENSLSQTTTVTSAQKQTKHIIPAHISASTAEDSITSKNVYISTSLDPVLSLQMYTDSSERTLAMDDLSSEAPVSVDLLLDPRQSQSPPERRQSSFSFSMSPGPPCLFTHSKKHTHPDALYVSNDNNQSPLEGPQAPISLEVKREQSPSSSNLPLLLLLLFGSDSLPGASSQRDLTRFVSEGSTFRADGSPHPISEHISDEHGHAGSLSGTADEKKHVVGDGHVFSIEASRVQNVDMINTHMTEPSAEDNSSIFIAQTIRKPEHFINEMNELDSVFTAQIEGRDHDHTIKKPGKSKLDSSMVVGNDETKDKVKTYEDYPNLSTLETIMSKNYGPTPQPIEGIHGQSVAEIDFENEYDVNSIFAAQNTSETNENLFSLSEQQIAEEPLNFLSKEEKITAKTGHHVSLASTANRRDFIMSGDPHEEEMSTGGSGHAVAEKSSQATSKAKSFLYTVQAKYQFEPSSSEPHSTQAIGQIDPTQNANTTTSIQNAEDHKISIQTVTQRQSGMTTPTYAISEYEQGIQRGMSIVKSTHRAERTHDASITNDKGSERPSLKQVIITQIQNRASEASRVMPGRYSAVHDSSKLERADLHGKYFLPDKTSTTQMILGVLADYIIPAGIPTTSVNTRTEGAPSGDTFIAEPNSHKTTSCAVSDNTIQTKAEININHVTLVNPHEVQVSNGTNSFNSEQTVFREIKSQTRDNFDSGMTAKLTTAFKHAAAFNAEPSTSEGGVNHHIFKKTTKRNNSNIDRTSPVTYRRVVVTDNFVPRQSTDQTQSLEKTSTQRDVSRGSAEVPNIIVREANLSKVIRRVIIAQNPEKTTDYTSLAKLKTKGQSDGQTAKAEALEAQKAFGSDSVSSGDDKPVQESGRKMSLLESESGSQLPRLKQRRRPSTDLYLSGVTEVSDDLCGSGNYTAEMSVNLEGGVQPGDLVPALANVRVVINLRTNNSLVNLEVKSCCLSPTIQPDLTNSTCCLFSRLAAESVGIKLLPSILSTSASFTISLFQMINSSVAYLHCDLSVCLSNHSDCERLCLLQRSAFPSENPKAAVTDPRNRISFGPMLKEMENSTFPEEIDPAEVDLVLVILSLVVACSVVTTSLLLVWLAYRRRANRLVLSAALHHTCCRDAGGFHREGGSIQP